MALEALKRAVKACLWRSPGPIDRALSSLLHSIGLANRAFVAFSRVGRPLTIAAGPFKGLKYIREAAGSALYPKIFGTYELELFEIIEGLRSGGYDVLLNIGSAEGYYAVGLCQLLPELRVLAYDIDPRARVLLERLSSDNGVVERISMRSECTAELLHEDLELSSNPLVVCDCEGAEEGILDPVLCPNLDKATVLVELHDCFVAGISELIRERFQGTHDIEVVERADRVAADFQAEGFELLGAEDRVALMNEWRDPNQRWFFMRPKKRT